MIIEVRICGLFGKCDFTGWLGGHWDVMARMDYTRDALPATGFKIGAPPRMTEAAQAQRSWCCAPDATLTYPVHVRHLNLFVQ
jgi:hypothetical protein